MDTLYHYCNSSTFESIISNKSIWLSSLSLSNDAMEGRLVSHIFEELLKDSSIGSDEIDEIRQAVRFSGEMLDGLGFCLSEKPDLLSQWRGYSDDGHGFSIGFNKNYLTDLSEDKNGHKHSFKLHRVIYDHKEHIKALKPTFDEIKSLCDSGKLKKPPMPTLLSLYSEEEMEEKKNEYQKAVMVMWKKLLNTIPSLYILKNHAFAEEAEWRLISYLLKDGEDSSSFRSARNRLIPYREIDLKKTSEKSISEVYLGPKNITPEFVIDKFLIKNGYENVSIIRSSATYR